MQGQIKPLINKNKLSDKNKKSMERLEEKERLEWKKDNDRIRLIFSKERMLSYISVILCPPYALYRIWYEKSTFTETEKIIWTAMVLICMGRFIYAIL